MQLTAMRLQLTVAALLAGALLLLQVPGATYASSDCAWSADAAETDALLEFMAGLDPPSVAQLNWSPSTDPCCEPWTGILCLDPADGIIHVSSL